MDRREKQAFVAIPIVIIIGALVALVGSPGSIKLGNFPLYAGCVLASFVIQWLVFIPAYLTRSEKYFDLTGSATYVSVMLFALLASGGSDLRSWLIGILVIIWAVRLGTFLFRRIQAAGKDERFDHLKSSFLRFLFTWTLQGLWVTFSLAAALAAVTAIEKVDLGIVGFIGLGIWIIGFGLELVADYQKSQFRSDDANRGKFISSGLWSWSRHPNYFGEIVLWIGIAVIAFPVLSGWQYVTLISPIFVILLLTRISGIPLLEARADEKWGGQVDYEAYKARTSVLIPRPPR